MIEILVPVYVVMALGAARVSYDVLAEREERVPLSVRRPSALLVIAAGLTGCLWPVSVARRFFVWMAR